MRIIGRIEALSPERISGYCYDADHPKRPVTLDLYIGEHHIATQDASLRRPELPKSKFPYKRCGFEFSLASSPISPTEQNVRIIAQEDNSKLGFHALCWDKGRLYPDRIDPELAKEASVYDELVIVNHIPKTAGTSLRIALEDVYQKTSCIYHYVDLIHCDEYIWNWKRFSHPTKTFEQVLRSILDRRIRVLLGHFGDGEGRGLVEFLTCFPKAKLITFVREPFQQSYSLYQHVENYHGKLVPYESFIERPEYQNFQAKHLDGIALQRYDFVGIVEEFGSCLKLLSEYLNQPLAENFVNAHRAEKTAVYQASSVIEEHVLVRFLELNQLDVTLYEEGKKRFKTSRFVDLN